LPWSSTINAETGHGVSSGVGVAYGVAVTGNRVSMDDSAGDTVGVATGVTVANAVIVAFGEAVAMGVGVCNPVPCTKRSTNVDEPIGSSVFPR
jgi:hypothetical protein